MRQFTTIQKKKLKVLASQFRRNKIGAQEYHNQLQKYYS